MQVDLTQLIEALPGLGWTAFPDGRAEFLNQRWLTYTGMTAQQAEGWGWAEAIHPDDRKRLTEHWESCLPSGTPVDVEGRMRRFDGSYRWFVFRANALRNEAGNISRWVGTNMDIEDRRRGEEALRAREISWRQIVDSVPGLVATMGPLGDVEFLNRQTLEYFGKSTNELKDWSLIGAVHPDDVLRVVQARAKSIETGQLYEVEHRCRRADGIYRWFQVRGVPVRDTNGSITTWYLLLTDIDDRKKAEEALRSNERNLSLMMDIIPTGIHVLHTDGSVLYVNRAVLDYTGLTLEDVKKESYRTRFFHPEDEERLREERRQALARPAPYENEQRIRGKDGSYRWYLVRYNPLLDEHGRIVRWYTAGFDIEGRKRAEAQLEQAYLRLTEAQRVSKTGSFITDLVADEHNWSEEAFRVFGFDPATKVTMQMIREMVRQEDLRSFNAMIARALEGADVDFSFRITTAQGSLKHVRGMARVIEQVQGRPLFIGALQDITESKVAEEALHNARSELARVVRVTTLNTLTASIAHEVNQPLSGIITNASTCLRKLNGVPPNVDGGREAVQRIIRDGNRAAEVIARLRALFSKKEFALEAVDLNDATQEVIALSLSDLRKNGVIMHSDLGENIPPVTGDRVQLQQVILNLVRNASEAMAGVEDRQREALIKTERVGDCVHLSVTDAGVGFRPETADRLFEPFYTTKNDGMGIGLSVSRSIIAAHHGRLWAAANDGAGATFAFSIPCTRAPPA